MFKSAQVKNKNNVFVYMPGSSNYLKLHIKQQHIMIWNTAILCISFTILIYAMWNAIRNWKKNLMIWYFYDMLYYAMLYLDIWTKTSPHTEDFNTLRSRIMIKNKVCQLSAMLTLILWNKCIKFELTLCWMLRYGIPWYAMTNKKLMICYEIKMLYHEI